MATRPRRDRGTGHYESTLTDEVIEQLTQLVTTGVSPEGAVGYAGVPKRTFARWMYDGRRDPENHPREARLVEALDEALGRFEAAAIVGVRQQGDWRWLLERRLPDRYGKRVFQDVQVTATSDDPRIVALHQAGFEGDASLLTEDELETLITLLHKAIPQPAEPPQLGPGLPVIEQRSDNGQAA